MIRWSLGLVVLWLSFHAFANITVTGERPITYYGEKFYIDLQNGLNENSLRAELHTILSSTHIFNEGTWDEITSCQVGRTQGCYQHLTFSYSDARKKLFGDIFLIQSDQYYLKDVYCNTSYSSQQVGGTIGPGLIPDHNVLNTEHSWPQSKFNRQFRLEQQKSDLFILYPVSTRINSSRGNIEFGEVYKTTSKTCAAAKRGHAVRGSSATYFEPPNEIKGDIARSLFYFAIRYNASLSQEQEYFLRKWHQQDPVDLDELMKQEKIYYFQGIRNPFIDHPSLINLMSDL
ncbi:MAG: endonuclease [Bdellovibrionales bacterium]|nr:endonuclease [Bdellovibrionales bacterium]